MTDIRVMLAGNQNSGKTTLFNALTGAQQYVGNWPGVTLEAAVGRIPERRMQLIDLPGLYSLAPYAPEEIVTRRVLLSGSTDVIINVIDAVHLERGLALTAQLLSLRLPLVVALNMMDLTAAQGLEVSPQALQRVLGVPVVGVCAARGEGLKELLDAAAQAAVDPVPQAPAVYAPEVNQAAARLAALLPSSCRCGREFAALALLERDRLYLEDFTDEKLKSAAARERSALESSFNDDMESLMAAQRFAFAQRCTKACTVVKRQTARTLSQRIDDVVTHKYLALPLFALIVYAVYYLAVSTVGTWGTDYANDVIFGEYAVNAAAALLESINAPEWLSGLVIDGIIGGVGAVLGFVPQMIVLFLLLAVLEQSGYMMRVAFVLDRIFRRFGLSGRCFIPMVIASGCGVPALMAARSIDNINERRLTLITTTFVPCSAKLPILAMIAAAFFPGNTWVAPGVYLLAILSIAVTGIILKKRSAFKEPVSPFVLELPDYHLPTLKNVLLSVYMRCRAFVIKAGTIIFSVVVAVWFLSSFGFGPEGFGMVDVSESMLAGIGTAVAWIFIPLGFASWQCAVAVFTGLLAKENVVGTLAVLLGLGAVAEDDAGLSAALQTEFPVTAAAVSFLAFNLFSTPCIAALGAMKRQLASRRMFVFAISYMTAWAYGLSLVIYQLGGLAAGQVPFGPWTIAALIVLGAALFLLFRPERANLPALVIPSKSV